MTETSLDHTLSWLPQRMADVGAPAVSVAIVDGDDVEAAAFGVTTSGEDTPTTTASLFQAASISKPISCLAVLRLVARGELDLDTDVNAYLREWQVPRVGDWQPAVTLRQLMSHTAGMTVHGFAGYPRDASLPTTRQILDGLPPANSEPVRVAGLPGLRWRYSGGGTTIVQQVLCDVTGESFPSLVRDLVLDPAGMTSATYEQPLPANLASSTVSAHRADGSIVPGGWHVYPELAAAALWCTPTDLCRAAIAVRHSLEGRRGSLLPRALAEEALRPVWPGRVGLGWFVDGTYFGHGGKNEGFLSELTASTTGGHACAVMTNSDAGSALRGEVINSVAAARTWPDFTPRPPLPFTDVVELLSRYAGRYETANGSVFVVEAGPNALTLHAPGQPGIEIELLFTWPMSSPPTAGVLPGLPTTLTFTFDDAGAASTLVLREPGIEATATRRSS